MSQTFWRPKHCNSCIFLRSNWPRPFGGKLTFRSDLQSDALYLSKILEELKPLRALQALPVPWFHLFISFRLLTPCGSALSSRLVQNHTLQLPSWIFHWDAPERLKFSWKNKQFWICLYVLAFWSSASFMPSLTNLCIASKDAPVFGLGCHVDSFDEDLTGCSWFLPAGSTETIWNNEWLMNTFCVQHTPIKSSNTSISSMAMTTRLIQNTAKSWNVLRNKTHRIYPNFGYVTCPITPKCNFDVLGP